MPYAAPPKCEHLCAHAFLYGQTRDDLADDGVREISDVVRTRLNMVLGSTGGPRSLLLTSSEGTGTAANLVFLLLEARFFISIAELVPPPLQLSVRLIWEEG